MWTWFLNLFRSEEDRANAWVMKLAAKAQKDIDNVRAEIRTAVNSADADANAVISNLRAKEAALVSRLEQIKKLL